MPKVLSGHGCVMRWFFWFAAVSGLVLGTWMFWGGHWDEAFTFDGSVRRLGQAGAWAWAAGYGLLAADLVLPVPGTVVIAALGYLYGVVLGGFIAGCGMMTAGLLGYGLGWFLGERFARRWLGERDYEVGRSLFVKGGGWIVAVSRALPVLPEVISCTAGLVRMDFRRFVVALACGSFPMGLLFAAIGQAGRDSPVWAVALSFMLPALLWWGASRLRRDI
jgi:uncharacterized membrane protein YdjX (TVP38/TMEM64 family)